MNFGSENLGLSSEFRVQSSKFKVPMEHLRLVLKSAMLWIFIIVVIYFILNRP